jgi:hypothetical protein
MTPYRAEWRERAGQQRVVTVSTHGQRRERLDDRRADRPADADLVAPRLVIAGRCLVGWHAIRVGVSWITAHRMVWTNPTVRLSIAGCDHGVSWPTREQPSNPLALMRGGGWFRGLACLSGWARRSVCCRCQRRRGVGRRFCCARGSRLRLWATGWRGCRWDARSTIRRRSGCRSWIRCEGRGSDRGGCGS